METLEFLDSWLSRARLSQLYFGFWKYFRRGTLKLVFTFLKLSSVSVVRQPVSVGVHMNSGTQRVLSPLWYRWDLTQRFIVAVTVKRQLHVQNISSGGFFSCKESDVINYTLFTADICHPNGSIASGLSHNRTLDVQEDEICASAILAFAVSKNWPLSGLDFDSGGLARVNGATQPP